MILYTDIDFIIMKVKEKLVQKEGEASMLASVNKQVLLRDIFQQNNKIKYFVFYQTILFPSTSIYSGQILYQTILINDFDLTNTTTDIYHQMEVQLTELESIKTKLITERNDVAAVVRRELAKTCLMI